MTNHTHSTLCTVHEALCAALHHMMPVIYEAVDTALQRVDDVDEKPAIVNASSTEGKDPAASDDVPTAPPGNVEEQPVGVPGTTRMDEISGKDEESAVQVPASSSGSKPGKAKLKKRGRLIRAGDIDETESKRRRAGRQAKSAASDGDDRDDDSDEDDVDPRVTGHVNPDLGNQPDQAVNRRVRVWWPLDKTWYPGRITAYRARDSKHHIRYDDNEIEWLNLNKEKWKYK